MDLNETEKHARALMTAHGVGRLAFAFDNGKRRLGATHFYGSQPVRITLSKHFVACADADDIRDVVLHEIAHALAGKAAGHGPKWKAQARAIGAKPQRCAEVSAKMEASVKGYCPKCESVGSQMHRLPLRVYWCSKCAKSRKVKVGDRKTALKWYKNGKAVPLEAMPARYQREYTVGAAFNPAKRKAAKPKTLEDFFRL